MNNVYKLLSNSVVKLPGTQEHLTWAELVHGVVTFGQSGGGKTSGPGTHLFHAILSDRSNPGGLILCVKSDDRKRFEDEIQKAGRSQDLVILDKDSAYSVNPIEYELYRNGARNPNYNHSVDLLMDIFLLGENFQAGGSSGGENERYWDKQLRLLLKRLMILLVLADIPVTIANMRKLIVDSFSEDDVTEYAGLREIIQSSEGAQLDEAITQYLKWSESNFFLHVLDRAHRRDDLSDGEHDKLIEVSDYFLKQLVKISEKTKAIIFSSAEGLFDPFLDGILKSHFSTKMSQALRPENCYTKGTIILVDVSIKEEGISAIYANGIMKKQFQLCMERRVISNEKSPRPCFLWCDEYHYLVSAGDEKFQSSCRSSLTAGIYLTQSISGLKVSMGKDQATDKVNALLTNFGTQIFCANTSRETNVYASDLIGKDYKNMNSSSVDSRDTMSRSHREELQYVIPPETFLKLRTGTTKNNYKVDSIVTVSGKAWKTGHNYCGVIFDQRGNDNGFFGYLKSKIRA